MSICVLFIPCPKMHKYFPSICLILFHCLLSLILPLPFIATKEIPGSHPAAPMH